MARQLFPMYPASFRKTCTAAGSSVGLHLRWLRLIGFCRVPPFAQVSASMAVLARFYHVFALITTSTYVIQQLIYAYQERNDMENLSRVLFIMLCHVTCVAKQIVFHTDAEQIETLIALLDDGLFNQHEDWQRALLRQTEAVARRLVRLYAGCAVATCVLWTAFPVLDKWHARTVQFPFWIGLDYNQAHTFIFVLVYSFYTTNLVAIGNTTMDAFMVTILYQCKTQFRILRINFETLPQRAHLIASESGEKIDSIARRLFVECLNHYQKITETNAILQSIFGAPLLVQFGVGGWILCMAAYKIVSLNVMSIEFASTTLFIVCILTELFLYCYYGNELTVESDRMVESMYNMEWLMVSVALRRSLVVAMERAKRPLRPCAGFVIPLTLETFVKILKSSYSFYAVLRQTK